MSRRSRRSRGDREMAEAAQRVAARAVWRLGVLEWLILGGAMALALAGGAGVAWLIAPTTGFPFRTVWTTTSFLLFVIPGVIAFTRARYAARKTDRLNPTNP